MNAFFLKKLTNSLTLKVFWWVGGWLFFIITSVLWGVASSSQTIRSSMRIPPDPLTGFPAQIITNAFWGYLVIEKAAN